MRSATARERTRHAARCRFSVAGQMGSNDRPAYALPAPERKPVSATPPARAPRPWAEPSVPADRRGAETARRAGEAQSSNRPRRPSLLNSPNHPTSLSSAATSPRQAASRRQNPRPASRPRALPAPRSRPSPYLPDRRGRPARRSPFSSRACRRHRRDRHHRRPRRTAPRRRGRPPPPAPHDRPAPPAPGHRRSATVSAAPRRRRPRRHSRWPCSRPRPRRPDERVSTNGARGATSGGTESGRGSGWDRNGTVGQVRLSNSPGPSKDTP